MGLAFTRLAATAGLILAGMETVDTARAERCPVVLVHGFKDTSAKMQPMARLLRREGWEVHTPTLAPSWGQVGVEELAGQLQTYLKANFQPQQRLDIVAFSMGGIVSRYYLQRLGGVKRVRQFLTISTPHRGTIMASLVPKLIRTGRPGVADLTIDSALLRDLNSDAAMLGQIRFTSMWTPLDLMILPAASSRMTGAREVVMWVVAHPLMVLEPRCLRRVAELLRE